MSARGIGAIVGVIVGLILCVIIYRLCNSNKKLKTEYDERQETIRGRAYKYGFYTALFYFAFLTIWPLTEIQLIFDDSVLGFSGLLISVCVVTVYSIWNDAYWGMNNDKKKYLIVFLLATVFNLADGILMLAKGAMVEDGIIQAPFVNLLCGILFVVIIVTMILKKSLKKEED